MARGKAKRKARPAIAEPTPEQFARGTFQQGGNLATGLNDRNGLAYRRIPVIDTMAQTGKLSARQHYGLARYRDTAIAEERSPMRDSLDKALHGRAGATDGIGYIRTAHELRRLEDALGSLWAIARAVAVDDTTVSQWAIGKGGTNADGSPKRVWAETGMMDIKMAGERLAAAIGA